MSTPDQVSRTTPSAETKIVVGLALAVLASAALVGAEEVTPAAAGEKVSFPATFVRVAYNDEGWVTVGFRLANESVGGAQVMLDSSVEYSKIRMQFGRAIGSFQAVKHRCADMLVEVELAKSAAYYAAQAAASGDPELPALACLAKAAASDAFVSTAASCIQIHGGIGFTWEHPAHLYFRRAKSSDLLFGDAAYQRELLAQRLGIERGDAGPVSQGGRA